MTTTSLLDAAQNLVDLYNGDYAPEGAFIGIDNVAPMMLSAYEDALAADYRQAKLLAKVTDGFVGLVPMESESIIIEKINIEKDGDRWVGKLTNTVYSFGPFDSMGTGLQRVRKTEGDCDKELIRISPNDEWTAAIIPPVSKTFYFPQTIQRSVDCPAHARIVIIGPCAPKEVEVQYVPGLSEGGDMQIATRFVKRITDSVLQTLLIAKQQVVVDKSNDGNPNVAPATELNPQSIKQNT